MLLDPRQIGMIRWIEFDIAERDGLFQRLVKRAVYVLDALRGKRLLLYDLLPAHRPCDRVPIPHKRVIEFLNVNGRKRRELDRAESGLDMHADILLIGFRRHRLNAVQVFPTPCVEPFPHGHFGRGDVCAVGYLHSSSLHLFPDFLLCFAGKRALNLPPPPILAGSDTRFPERILLSVTGHRLFSYRSRSGCGFIWHYLPPFQFCTQYIPLQLH